MKLNDLLDRFKNRSPLLLIVLDGWGVGDGGSGDAIQQAQIPHFRSLGRVFSGTRLFTHGLYVGLPSEKDIGGSEVGHMTMGAGRTIPQGPTRIQQMMDSGKFFSTPELKELIDNCLQSDAPLHLLGLLSDGNVHSHIDHFHRIIDYAEKWGVRRLYVHALLDGRDVPYQSALDYIEPLEAQLARINSNHPGWDYAIASGGGREVITMDRDRNWDKVRRGWEVHVAGRCDNAFPSASEAVKAFREQNAEVMDQDLPPFVVARDGRAVGPMEDGHSVIFMNFRGDRAIQFSRAMVEDDFSDFQREDRPDLLFAGMMTYDADTNLPPRVLMRPTSVARPFGKRSVEQGLDQFRLAETQKYAHVTFFFNGGYREPLDPAKEEYVLIPSDKIDSFALAPEMKAREIGEKARDLILSGRFGFGLINFANTDMVGHTGNLRSAVKAAEAVDLALGIIFDALAQQGGLAIVTSDHGNAEEMISPNPGTGVIEINTRHSLNPVPFYLFDSEFRGEYWFKKLSEDEPLTLANLAATLFILMGQTPPDDTAPPLFMLD